MLLVTMNKEHHNNVNITFIFKVKADNEISNIDYKAIIVNTEKMSDSPPHLKAIWNNSNAQPNLSNHQ